MENVTMPKGFVFAGTHCGIKKIKKDLVLFYCKDNCNAAGVFTKNAFKAAPVKLCEKHIASGSANAIIVNSGIANAATGKDGEYAAELTAFTTAKELSIKKSEVLVCSTGIIGKKLPLKKITSFLPELVKSLGCKKKNIIDSAEAILTTDKKTKIVSKKIGETTILGIAKGSGMINPNMATMLCFFFTDAKIGKKELKKALKTAVDNSFNQLSVDGCESTNDSVIILSNQEGQQIDFKKFSSALTESAVTLAKMIVKDAEGAEKMIIVKVTGAPNTKTAKKISKSIVSSDLVKTCVHGCDPNVGRIISAAGNSSNQCEGNGLTAKVCGTPIFSNWEMQKFDKALLGKKMTKKEITIEVNMNQGNCSAEAFGCDLTQKYVKFNSKYYT